MLLPSPEVFVSYSFLPRHTDLASPKKASLPGGIPFPLYGLTFILFISLFPLLGAKMPNYSRLCKSTSSLRKWLPRVGGGFFFSRIRFRLLPVSVRTVFWVTFFFLSHLRRPPLIFFWGLKQVSLIGSRCSTFVSQLLVTTFFIIRNGLFFWN